MPKKLVTELSLQDKMSRAIDVAKGKVQNFNDGIKNSGKQLLNLQNLAIGTFAGIIVKETIKAASAMEIFATQLEVVTGNAELAGQKLSIIRKFAQESPLETEDVVQAFVNLRAVGIDPTIKQMETLGSVAVLMNRRMTDMLGAVIGVEKEPLRRLGIEIDRTGQKAIIQSGNIKKVVEKDMASIREAIFETWEERFPGAMEKASATTKSHIAIMKSQIFELSATIGTVLLPMVNKIAKSIGNQADILNQYLKMEGPDYEESVQRLFEGTQKGIAQREKSLKKLINYYRIANKEIPKSIINKLAENEADKESIRLIILRSKLRSQYMKSETRGATGDVLGTGQLGPKTAEGQKATTKIKEVKQAYSEFGKDPKKHSLDYEREIMIKSMEQKQEMNGVLYTLELEHVRHLRESSEEKMRIWEIELNRENEVHQQRTHNWRVASKDRVDIEMKEKDLIINSSLKLGQSMLSFSKEMMKQSKADAKQKKAIMAALAVAEVSMAVISGVRQAQNLPPPANMIMAAATAIQIMAMTLSHVNSIKNASFRTGTTSAPGGWSLVGEQGPELTRLPKGSVVRTAVQTRQSIGGMNYRPVINIYGNADESTVISMGENLERMSENIEEAVRRGYLNLAELGQ